MIDGDAEQAGVTVRLPAEAPVHGRVLDLQGGAVAGVKVHVAWLAQENGHGLSEPAADLQFWPGPVTADKDGRFVLRGIGRGWNVALTVRDARFAHAERRS